MGAAEWAEAPVSNGHSTGFMMGYVLEDRHSTAPPLSAPCAALCCEHWHHHRHTGGLLPWLEFDMFAGRRTVW